MNTSSWKDAKTPQDRVRVLAPLVLALPGNPLNPTEKGEVLERLFTEISLAEQLPVKAPKVSTDGEQTSVEKEASSSTLSPTEHPQLFGWITSLAAGPNGRGTLINDCLTAGPQAVCGKILSRRDVAYKCLDCSADPTCVMCVDCFNHSPCQGHEYRMVRSGGGMCDCGDPTAWKTESFCSHHGGLTADSDPTQNIPKEHHLWIGVLVKYSLRLMLQLADALHANGCALITQSTELPATATALRALGEHLLHLASTGDSGKRLIATGLAQPLSSIDFVLGSNEEDDAQPTAGGLQGPAPVARTSLATHSIMSSFIRAMPVDKVVTVMDCVMWYETECRRPTAAWLQCWNPIRDIVELVLSDPMVKPVYTASLCFMMERAQRHYAVLESSKLGFKASKTLMQSSVQTLTVPPVVAELMAPGSITSYVGFQPSENKSTHCASQTLLHRLFAGHMLSLCFAVHTGTEGGLPGVKLAKTATRASGVKKAVKVSVAKARTAASRAVGKVRGTQSSPVENAESTESSNQRNLFTFRVGVPDPTPRNNRRSGDEIALFHSVHNFRYTLLASSRAGASVFSSRSLLRALLNIYQVEQVSGFFWRLPDAKTNYSLPFDLEYANTAGLWNLIDQLKELLEAVCLDKLDQLFPVEWQHTYLKEMEQREEYDADDTLGENDTSKTKEEKESPSQNNAVWGIPGSLNHAGLTTAMQDEDNEFSVQSLYLGLLAKCRDGPLPPHGPKPTQQQGGSAAARLLATPTLLLDSADAHLDSKDRMVASVQHMTGEMIAYILEAATLGLSYVTSKADGRERTHTTRSLFLHYDPLADKRQGASFNLPLCRIFSLTVGTCLNTLSKYARSTNYDASGVLAKLFHAQSLSFNEMTLLIDQPLMSFVVADQVFDNQWERDHMDVKSRSNVRDVNASYFVEVYLLLLQLSCATVGSRRMASQMLDRYSYQPTSTEKVKLPHGYSQFLQLVLQMVCDSSKTNEKQHSWQTGTNSQDGPASSVAGGRAASAAATAGLSKAQKKELAAVDPNVLQKVVQRLALTPAPRSEIMKALNKSELDEEEDETVLADQVSIVLRVLCNQETRRTGNTYSLLKDDAVWSLVMPYCCSWRPNYVHLSKRQYQNLQPSEKAKQMRGKGATSVMYPVARIGNHGAMLSQSLRNLLHQKTTLSVAMLVLICWVRTESDGSCYEVDFGAVSLAIDTLHLTLQDIRSRFSNARTGKIRWSDYTESITMAIANEQSLAPGPDVGTTTAPASYDTMSPLKLPSDTPEGLHHALMATFGEISLPQGEKKPRKVRALTGFEALKAFGDSCESDTAPQLQADLAWKVKDIVVTMDRYKEYLSKRTQNHDLDSDLEADEDETAAHTTEESEVVGGLSAADLKRKAALKKQSAALAKMKARAKATLEAQHVDPTTSGMNDEAPTQEASKEERADISQSLLPTTDFYLQSLECVYCRRPGEESDPLVLLAHTATSASLHDLGCGPGNHNTTSASAHDAHADEESGCDKHDRKEKTSHRNTQARGSDDEKSSSDDDEGDDKYLAEVQYSTKPLNAMVISCGHATHLSCVTKQQVFQARVEARGSWRQLMMSGQSYRGMDKVLSPEVLCPVCGRICRSLLLSPQVRSDKTAGAADVAATVQELSSEHMYEAGIGFNKNVESPSVKRLSLAYVADQTEHVLSMVASLSDSLVMVTHGVVTLGQAFTFRHLVTLNAALKTLQFRNCHFAPADGVKPRPPVADLLDRFSANEAQQIADGTHSTRTLPSISMQVLLQLLLAHDECEDLSATGSIKVEKLQCVLSSCFTAVAGNASDETTTFTITVLFAIMKLVFIGEGLASQKETIQQNAKKFVEISDDVEGTEDLAATVVTTDMAFEELDPSNGTPIGEGIATLSTYIQDTTHCTPEESSISAEVSEKLASSSSALWVPPPCNVDTGYDYLFEEVLFFPKSYSGYVKYCSQELGGVCSNCGKVPKQIALCLKCKKMFCLEGKPPELFEHARQCGGGTSLFCAVKKNLYLAIQASSGRASQIGSVYVDRYGEKDPGLNRGVPLRLHTERARELVKQWFYVGFDHSTEILSNTWSRSIKEL